MYCLLSFPAPLPFAYLGILTESEFNCFSTTANAALCCTAGKQGSDTLHHNSRGVRKLLCLQLAARLR